MQRTWLVWRPRRRYSVPSSHGAAGVTIFTCSCWHHYQVCHQSNSTLSNPGALLYMFAAYGVLCVRIMFFPNAVNR
jgi:hypothetical protein